MNNVLTSPERPQAFSHGDQIQIRQFDALHYAHLPDLGPVTLTVTRAESGRLTVTTVEGDVYTLAAPVGETPGQHHDILTLHPWERLAARFPAALRLDPVAGEGVTLSVTVGAGRDFVPVGHLRADGEAEIDARSSGLLEEALMVLADAEGMDWGLLGGGEGPVCAWIRVWHRDGSLWTPSGHAPQVWLALARAMRLALDTMDARLLWAVTGLRRRSALPGFSLLEVTSVLLPTPRRPSRTCAARRSRWPGCPGGKSMGVS